MIKFPCVTAVLGAVLAVPVFVGAAPLGTAFTYQGQLKNSGSPVTAPCNFTFALFDASAIGAQKGPTLTPAVPVTNGVFTVSLDFGSQWNGDARFLDVTVQCPGDTSATSLGRQPLTGTPYSISTTQLQGQPVSQTAPSSAGQALVWSGAAWQPGEARNIAYRDAANTFTLANTFSNDVTFSNGEVNFYQDVFINARLFVPALPLSGTEAVNKNYVDNATSSSDRNLKTDIVPVDPRHVLRGVLGLPIATWSYKSDPPAVRHIGAMAQDFHAAFKVGDSDTRIMPIDSGGVVMASIQALHQEIEDRDAKIDALRGQIEELRALVCAGSEDAPICRAR